MLLGLEVLTERRDAARRLPGLSCHPAHSEHRRSVREHGQPLPSTLRAIERIRPRAEAGAFPININAALACFLSSTGKERPGPANLLVGILERVFWVRRAIKCPFAHALAPFG